MRKIATYRWLSLIILAIIYIFVPVAEGLACEDCSLPVSETGDGHQNHCSICSSASSVSSYDFSTHYGSTSSDPQVNYVSYAEPFFPINKPPQ